MGEGEGWGEGEGQGKGEAEAGQWQNGLCDCCSSCRNCKLLMKFQIIHIFNIITCLKVTNMI